MNDPANAVPSPGAHGGDGARVAAALGLDPASVLELSASLNPVAPDPATIVARHLDALGRYPDPERATAALAETMGVDRDRLVLTNGGAEAITLVGSLLGGTVDEPDFSLHPRGPATDRRSAGWAPAEPPRWRSNPHSPTGRLAEPEEQVGVWDEAFWPLATGTWTRGDHEHGSVVVGSLTKLFSCPGLRLGYVLAPTSTFGDRLVGAVREVQPDWSVSGLALDALPDLLALADLPMWSAAIADLRTTLVEVLVGHDLTVKEADAPWVLVEDPGGLRDALAREGIVVRDCTSFGLAGTLRLAVPGDDDRERLARALDRVR